MRKKNAAGSRKPPTDPDDAPELTADWFARANFMIGDKLISRGRPKLENPKEPINLRLDADTLARWRASGPGWQTRMSATLDKHAPRRKKRARG